MKAYMSLSCKAGKYQKVLQELMDMNIASGNIHLLFGPVDILCEFNFNTLEEFKKKWFNRVRMIGGDKEWITRTQTFIVIEIGRETIEEPFAFLFLNTQPRNLERVQSLLLEMKEVLMADTVFGPYDVICSVKARDQKDLERTVSYIQNIQGVDGSITAIVAGMSI